MKVIELFAGVGSQTQALKNIGVEHDVIGISEIDKYAISSYEQLHEQTHNFGDISKIETLPGVDLWTYSFPCQDLSVAGRGEGIKEGTRSGLLFQVERLLEVSEKPKYLLMENVKNLVGKKHKVDFDIWCSKLEELGYKNYWKVLNAKDYGVPQNRERVFMVSILGEHQEYIFPEKKELELRLKDFIDDVAEEKYYINKEWHYTLENEQKHDNNEIAKVHLHPNFKEVNSVGDTGKICRCLTTMGGGQREPKILVNSSKELRVRKLTPKECWRLMGWKDEQFNKIKGISNSQLYKQAGNGIVVNVLEGIFKNLFIDSGKNE